MPDKASKRNRKKILKYCLLAVVVLVGYLVIHARQSGSTEPTYSTAAVERGSVTASVSANGVLQPVTTVEVKSNVGGQVVELAVDEGDVVKAGQVIAKIDPSDSMSNLQQTAADYRSAKAKVQQTRQGFSMQQLQTAASIEAAVQALEADRQRLAQAQKQAQIQPKLTQEAIRQAQSNLDSVQASLHQTRTALVPQKLASAKAGYDQAKAGYDKANNDVARKRALLEKGFISKSQVDASEEQYSVAKAQLDNAKSKSDTVKDESDQDLKSVEAKVAQAKSALETAKANGVQDDLKRQELAAARASMKQSMASLRSAQAGTYQGQMKNEDIIQAQAQLERAAATVRNAQTQMNYTTVVAPRAGVVVKKYVEKGSIVTAGRSSFSGTGSGVTIVDIADTTRMMVQVGVDETDIAQIEEGQDVDITVEAYPDEIFSGKVTKIAPQSVTEQNVTTIPVTVEVDIPDQRLKPGMNATCEFITGRADDVLMVPSEAVNESDNGSTVMVLSHGKQITRKVEIGLIGSESTEIKSGLKKGEKVITSVIQSTSTGGTSGGMGAPGGMGGPGGGMRRGM